MKNFDSSWRLLNKLHGKSHGIVFPIFFVNPVFIVFLLLNYSRVVIVLTKSAPALNWISRLLCNELHNFYYKIRLFLCFQGIELN